MTAWEISAAVRAGELTARAAVEQSLDRIQRQDPAVGAFRTVRAEQARAEADLVDARADRHRLPLAGVPIAIKDNVPVTGESMRNGSAGSSAAGQTYDHEIVSRLRQAGAVVVGLTNVPELCVFGATDSAVGITRNPWNLAHSPGGSSGGSAAAVAAGMVPVAHGNDGMGSIRIPAACTGLVGIKPGLGTVPAELGDGSWFDMAENGPLATTTADCALVLSVLAGRPELAAIEPLAGHALRIGVSVKAPVRGLPVDREFTAATRQTADLLSGKGHSVRSAELRYPIAAGPAAMARWFAGAELDARLLADRSRLDRRVARHARLGRAVLALGGPRDRGRAALLRAAERYFTEFEVLITPALAQPPLRAIEWSSRGWAANVLANVRYAPFAAPWNLLGWPAMAVPAGIHRNGLPLSVQLVARPGGEALLLRLAAQLESLRPWQRIAPG
ncbi:MAG: amidase family protein [Actinomycetota bacterium]|nr:amidase family protein [Actinomycetota bacterium]MDQ2956369.1 amidase family protein [Actinomycetota bacterium]